MKRSLLRFGYMTGCLKWKILAMEEGDFKEYINPASLQVIKQAYAEPALLHAKFDDRYQFIRKGYFCLDKDTSASRIVFNRTVTLKDAWVKEQRKSS